MTRNQICPPDLPTSSQQGTEALGVVRRIYTVGYSTHNSSSDINLENTKKELIDRQTFKKVMLSKCNVEPYLHPNLSKSVVQSETEWLGLALECSR